MFFQKDYVSAKNKFVELVNKANFDKIIIIIIKTKIKKIILYKKLNSIII